MMGKVTNVVRGVLVVMLFGLAGCGGGEDNETPSDSISITSVTPSNAIANQSTSFSVDVTYSLASKDSGLLMVGFNTNEVGKYAMISSQEYTVSKGSGTHTFIVTTTPVDWGSTGSFTANVNLSENPHTSSWTPLAFDFKIIPVSTGIAKLLMIPATSIECDNTVCY